MGLIPLVLIEVLLRGVFLLSGSQSPLVQVRPVPLDPEKALTKPIPNWLDVQVLHPYLGYVGDPAQTAYLNRLGWAGPNPLTPTGPEVFRVMLTGGSVAEQVFSQHAVIAREIQKILPAGRKVRVFSVARGGYKQPQQLQALTWLLSQGVRFDAVINLDGFNEVVLPFAENWKSGVALSYPRSWRLMGRKGFNPEIAERISQMHGWHETRKTLDQWARGPLRYSTTALTLISIATGIVDSRLVEGQRSLDKTLDESGNVQYTGPRKGLKFREVFAESSRIWERSSEQMKKICEANDIAYFHFLQPNQHVKGSKTLTPEEREIAKTGPRRFVKAVKEGYPYLWRQSRKLRRAGVAYFDLTWLFKEETPTVYSDNCCHFNPRGIHTLAATIGRKVAGALQNSPLRMAVRP